MLHMDMASETHINSGKSKGQAHYDGQKVVESGLVVETGFVHIRTHFL